MIPGSGLDGFVSDAHADNGVPVGASVPRGWVTALASYVNEGPNVLKGCILIDHDLEHADNVRRPLDNHNPEGEPGMNLSRHFTLEEMSFSNTARTLGIDNTPTADAAQSLRALCTTVLDPLRDALGSSIKVNSGYRGPALNARLKGAAKSQHLTGHAADIQAPGMTVVDLFKKVIQLKLPYDQLIYEVNGKSKWVHVSHNPGANRGVIMLGQFDAAGRVTFPRITAEQALAMSEPVTRSSSAAAPLSYIEGSDEPEDQAPAPKITRKPPAEAAAKTTPVKKTGADPRSARKPAAGKGVAKKTAPRKATPRKAAAKKAVVKKVAAKKVAAKKAVVKKAAAKKPVAKKAAVKKSPSKVPAKSPAKRASR